VRERLSLKGDKLAGKLAELRAIDGVREAFIVSTCNRLEIFAWASSRDAGDRIAAAIGPGAAALAVQKQGEDALRHLYRVAASLDSMVVGEAQILGQVKEAAAEAQRAGTMGAVLQGALQGALGAAKRVRTETEIARGAVSLSSVAVELSYKLLGELEKRSVLLLGAGEMAQLAASELRAQGALELLVANRSAQHAETLARQVGGTPVPLDDLPSLLERADVVICSTGAEKPVVMREMVARALKARRYRPLFLVDLALPRNVDPACNDLEGVYLYDLDDLERVAAENREQRAAQIGRAEAIIEEELKAALARAHERKAVPVLARLRAHAEAVARAEAEKTLSSMLRDLDEKQQKSVRAMASAIVNKLLHAPTARLRAEAGQGPLGDAAAALFALDEQAHSELPLQLVRNG
jgi:glutamyl-tRNA reductase